MRNAQIAQLISPACDAWQTTRYSVFARQSRVETNAQKDLEEMLAKLSNKTEEIGEVEKNDIQRKRKRKFLELALPCGTVAFFCLVYCLIYLVTSGQDISHSSKMKTYLEKLQHLETVIEVILNEAEARVEIMQSSKIEPIFQQTDEHLRTLLSAHTLVEWKLLKRIQDYRREEEQTQTNVITKAIKSSMFYIDFVHDVSNYIYQHGLNIDSLRRFKLYYEYQMSLNKLSRATLLLTVLNLVEYIKQTETVMSSSALTKANFILEYASYVGELLDNFQEKKKQLYKRELTKSYDLMLSIEEIAMSGTTTSVSGIHNSTSHSVSVFKIHLLEIQRTFIYEKKYLYKLLTDSNSGLFNGAILSCCFVFAAICVTVLGIVVFVSILKEESRISVSVSDWMASVSKELEDQKRVTISLIEQIVPQHLLHEVDFPMTCDRNMVPFHVSEATLLMSSIAHFECFFTLFTTAQTLQILTLVMNLLDDRMEQYQVLPVTKMGHNQIIISNSVDKHKKSQQHACEITNLAMDIMSCCSDLEIGKQPVSKLQMRLGIHTGPCIGIMRVRNGSIQFSLTGNSVAVLQKVHKTAHPNRIQVSDVTQKILDATETYSFHMRGKIKVKGVTDHKVYWLEGRRVSSSTMNIGSSPSIIGSWIEFERKPLYRLDEDEGTYEPIDKYKSRRYSQMSMSNSLWAYNETDNNTSNTRQCPNGVDESSSSFKTKREQRGKAKATRNSECPLNINVRNKSDNVMPYIRHSPTYDESCNSNSNSSHQRDMNRIEQNPNFKSSDDTAYQSISGELQSTSKSNAVCEISNRDISERESNNHVNVWMSEINLESFDENEMPVDAVADDARSAVLRHLSTVADEEDLYEGHHTINWTQSTALMVNSCNSSHSYITDSGI